MAVLGVYGAAGAGVLVTASVEFGTLRRGARLRLWRTGSGTLDPAILLVRELRRSIRHRLRPGDASPPTEELAEAMPGPELLGILVSGLDPDSAKPGDFLLGDGPATPG